MKYNQTNFIDQDHVFAFYLITKDVIKFFCYEWERSDQPLFIQMLNTVCGWQFVRGWKDKRYDFVTGKVVLMSDKIRQQVKKMKNDFLQDGENSNKKMICDLYNMISILINGNPFFVYRLVYSLPTQTDLFRIKTELYYIEQDKTKEKADEWFDKYAAQLFNEYNVIEYVEEKQGEIDKSKRVCRFCHRREPEVNFKKIAHAIPESIGGNRNLICYEECDECNERFGAEVESNLCNWFDVRRSQYGIKKKHGGIPNAYGCNYIIENQNTKIVLDTPASDKIKAIGSGTITLQGIYRSLCKIAIDLIEGEYLSRLKITIDWICFGKPKACKYPKIAQMCELNNVTNPSLYIFTRKDGLDTDSMPLHFCILRIFDMALLYTLPHVDGRMLFKSSYTSNINIEALKILGFNKKWEWDSYDTTEERNPHVIFDISKSIKEPNISERKVDWSKLRKERKPINNVDFKIPLVTDKDMVKHVISTMYYKKNIENNEFIQTFGNVYTECVFDLMARLPIWLRLKIVFVNVEKKEANVVYAEFKRIMQPHCNPN